MRTTNYASDLASDIRALIQRAILLGYDPRDTSRHGTSTVVLGMNHWAKMVCILWEDQDLESPGEFPVIRDGEACGWGMMLRTMPGAADNAMWIQDRNGKVVTW